MYQIRRLMEFELQKHKPDFIILTGIFFFLFFLYYFSGFLGHGYFMTDDHFISHTYDIINKDGFFASLKYWFGHEVNYVSRMRFFYRTTLCCQTWLFGLDWGVWNFMRFLSSFLCFTLFYKGFHNLSRHYGISILLGLYILFGPQCNIFQRFGPSERYGIIMLGFGFYFLCQYISTSRFKFIVLSLLACLLSSLSKESFILVIPSLALIPFLTNKHTFFSKSNIIILILYGILFSFLIGLSFYLNSKSPGYVDFERSIKLNELLTIFSENGMILFNLLVLLVIMTTHVLLVRSEKSYLSQIFIIGSYFLWILPKIVLYRTTAFGEGRYYLPFIVGLPIIVSVLFYNASFVNNKKRILFNSLSSIFVTFLIAHSIWGTSILKDTFFLDRSYRNIDQLLSNIEAHTSEADSILIVGDPAVNYEWMSLGLPKYLDIVLNKENVFYLELNVNHRGDGYLEYLKTDFYNMQKGNWFDEENIDLTQYKFIVVLPSIKWYKDEFFSYNDPQYLELFKSKSLLKPHFIKIKNDLFNSYVRHSLPQVDNLVPRFDSIPLYIRKINDKKITYKQIKHSYSWTTELQDTIKIEGIIEARNFTPVYLGIDLNFVLCNIRKRKKVNKTDFECVFTNLKFDKKKDYSINQLVTNKNKNDYRFLGTSFNQGKIPFED